jgi:hypothetical protein
MRYRAEQRDRDQPVNDEQSRGQTHPPAINQILDFPDY